MKLKPIDSADTIELVAHWLAWKENYQWLDFSNGHQVLTPVTLKMMTQRKIHVLRVFTADDNETPIGVVGLSDVNRKFRTATAWIVLGDKRCRGRGYATRAFSLILTLGFSVLRLEAINAWVVDANLPSLRMVKRNRFRYVGRRRECHYIDGRAHDRFLFHLLASEHRPLEDETAPLEAPSASLSERGAGNGSDLPWDARLTRRARPDRTPATAPQVTLQPLDTPALIDVVASWLAKKNNYQWLDFGNGQQLITPVSLKLMAQRDIHVLRVFATDPGGTPGGVVGLSNVDRCFRTASVWAVLGNKRWGGCTVRATSKLLTYGFTELGLRAINAWTVESNIASLRLLRQLNFHYIGRQRRCHYIDGRPLDRLLFDLLAHEHTEL